MKIPLDISIRKRRKKEAEDKIHSILVWEAKQALFAQMGKWCRYCGTTKRKISVDHIQALSRGGDPYRLSNMVPACVLCNEMKGSTDIAVFQRWVNHMRQVTMEEAADYFVTS